MKALTKLDRDLMALLKQDSSKTTTAIAETLGVSRTTVSDRIQRLLDAGIIKRFTIEISESNAEPDTSASAFFHIQLKRPVCKIVFESVQGWPELVGCWSIAGDTDMTIQVRCINDRKIEELRERLSRHPEIRKLWTAMVLRQWASRGQTQANYKVGGQRDKLDFRLEEITARDESSFNGDVLNPAP